MQAAAPGLAPAFVQSQATDASRQACDALYQCVARADPHAWSVVVSSVGEEAAAAWLSAGGPFWRAASVGQTWALLDGLARVGAYGLLATVAGRVCGSAGSDLHGSTSVARLALLAVRLLPDSCVAVAVHTALGLPAREAAAVVKAAVADGRRPLLPARGPRSRDAQFLAECVAVLVATRDESFFDDAIFLLLCALCTHAGSMQVVVSVMDDRFRTFREDEAFFAHLKRRIELSEVGTIRVSAVDHQLWVRAGVRAGLERAIAYCPSAEGSGGCGGNGDGDVVRRICDMLLIEGGTPAVKLVQNEEAFQQALVAYTGMSEVEEYELDALRTQVYGVLRQAEDGSQMFHYASGYSKRLFRCPKSVTVPAYPSLLSLFANCHWRESTEALPHLTTEQQTWMIDSGYRDACDYYRE